MGMKRSLLSASLLAAAALAMASAAQPTPRLTDNFNMGRARRKNPLPKAPKNLCPKYKNPSLKRR